MEESLNAGLECILCEDACSSMEDLRSHLSIAHQIAKASRPLYVQQSVEGKIAKKRRYQEEKYQEEKTVKNRSEFPAYGEASVATKEKTEEKEKEAVEEEETREEKSVQVRAKKRKPKSAAEKLVEAKFESEEFKNFLEGKAKSTFESLFGNLRMVLAGTIDPVETSRLGSETDIREGFSRLRSAIRSMPSSIEDDFRKEFEEKLAKPEKVKVSKFVPEVSSKNETNLKPVLSGEKEQIEIDPSLKKTILNPISSDQSNQSVGEKTVTTYFCPVSDSCKFTLTKTEMREMVKARQHLTDDHQIKLWEIQKANGTGKYKFGKAKTPISVN